MAIAKSIPSGLEFGMTCELQEQVWSSDGRGATITKSITCEPA